MLFDYVPVTTPHPLYPQSEDRIKRVISPARRRARTLPATLNFIRVALGQMLCDFVEGVLDRLDDVLIYPVPDFGKYARVTGTGFHLPRPTRRVLAKPQSRFRLRFNFTSRFL